MAQATRKPSDRPVDHQPVHGDDRKYRAALPLPRAQEPFWVATMPVAGTTAPIFMPAAYVQSTAELLAGLTLIHLMRDGAPIYCSIIDSIRAYPFDMRYASFVYGSPEDLLATLIQIQLNQFYGIPLVAKSLLTSASGRTPMRRRERVRAPAGRGLGAPASSSRWPVCRSTSLLGGAIGDRLRDRPACQAGLPGV